jgi:hypothetical protein
MAGRKVNTAASDQLRLTLSEQSHQLLEQIAALGIYGRSPPEVAARFVDAAVERFTDVPKFKIPGLRKAKVP